MAIDKTNDVVSFDGANVPVLRDMLNKICQDGVSSTTADTAAKAAEKADDGKICIMDDGTNRRVYFKTGKGETGYLELSVGSQNFVDLTTDQTVAGIKTMNGIVIENRTNDTGCTQTGRLWFRTDI